MSDGRTHIADKEALDEVNNKVGAAEDAESGTSLFAKINSLLSTLANHVAAWTSTRAAKLDNLDAAISSRASANTALSTAQWTNTRAGYLDKLNSGVAVASLAGKLVKSVQRGVIELAIGVGSGNLTINAVDTSKAIIVPAGRCYDGGNNYGDMFTNGMLTFTNSTTVNLERCSNSAGTLRVAVQVIEFY